MLYKGAIMRLLTKRGKNLFTAFHVSIIALIFCSFFLQGCGYKTKPVYVSCIVDSSLTTDFESAATKGHN